VQRLERLRAEVVQRREAAPPVVEALLQQRAPETPSLVLRVRADRLGGYYDTPCVTREMFSVSILPAA